MHDPRSAASLYAGATYLRWVIDTGQPRILTDTFKSLQSLLGVPNILTDIDCYLKPVITDSIYGVNPYLYQMQDWLEYLKIHRSHAPYVRRAEAVLNEIRALY
jgi:hypothetical protein